MTRRMLDKLPGLMGDPDFVAAWEEAQEEFSVAREIISARSRAGLSQKDLAEKIGTTQSVIARLESGSHAPSVSTLKKIANALDYRLNISFSLKTQASPAL